MVSVFRSNITEGGERLGDNVVQCKIFPAPGQADTWSSAMDLDNIIQSVLMRILLLLSGFSEIRTFIFTKKTVEHSAGSEWVAGLQKMLLE